MEVLLVQESEERHISIPRYGFSALIDTTGRFIRPLAEALLTKRHHAAPLGNTAIHWRDVSSTILTIHPFLNPPPSRSIADHLQIKPILEVFSRAEGEERCLNCGGEIRDVDVEVVTSIIVQEFSSKLIAVTTQLEDRKFLFSSRVIVGGVELDLDDTDQEVNAPFESIIDRLKVIETSLPRLADAINKGFAASGSLCIYPYPIASRPRTFRKGRSCIVCGLQAAGELYLNPGDSLTALFESTINDAHAILRAQSSTPATEYVDSLFTRCRALGLGHLSLKGSVSTLSKEEETLLAVALLIQPELHGVLYFLSDALRWLHPRDVERVANLFSFLKEMECAALALHTQRLEGNINTVELTDTQATPLQGSIAQRPISRTISSGGHSIPIPSLLGITGEAGCGKRELVKAIISEHGLSFEKVSEEWQVGGKAGRSFVAQFLKVWDPLTKLYAKLPRAIMRGVSNKDFKIVYDGTRVQLADGFQDLRFRSLSLSDLLGLTITEALDHLRNHKECERHLSAAASLGLGSLPLSSPLEGLTTSELQRLRLLRRLSRRAVNELLVFDLPAAGVPEAEAALIGAKLSDLVGEGTLVVVLDHSPSLLRYCDSVIAFEAGLETIIHHP